MRIAIAVACGGIEGIMVFEIWRCVTHAVVTPASELLSMVVLQGGSNFLSRIGSLGGLVCLFEILLGLATAVLGAIGVLICFGRNALCPGTAPIREKCRLVGDERQAQAEELPERNADITIRLERRYFWPLRRHRCIVTIRAAFGDAQNTGQEVWLAKGAKSQR